MGDAVSRPATPIQPQNEPDAQPDEITSSILHGCPICQVTYRRVQELNRHVLSHLPDYIHCRFQGCTWKGSRQSLFKEHWSSKHPEAGQAPAVEICDSKYFVKPIDGTLDDVVSATAKVQEDLIQHDVSMGDTLSRPDTPNPAPDQDEMEADAQRHETSPSTQLDCRICSAKFGRMQERNRHIESHLPHSILCLFQACTWTGRRQWDFKEHWRRKHTEAGQLPKEHENEIYDPKDFVTSIVDGAPVDKVARSAFAKVQEGLRRLGKPEVGAKVLGRSRDLREWIPIP